MPLSEEEQRILHEMEQKLYEHDPGFRGRVEARARHSLAGRSTRWSVLIFVIGFVVLLVAFRSSTVIAVFGFLVMLFAALDVRALGAPFRRSRGRHPPCR